MTLANGVVVNTPAMVVPTSLYSIKHLTRDIFETVLDPNQCIIEVYYEDVFENLDAIKAASEAGLDFKKFSNFRGYPLWLALREDRYFQNKEELTHNNSDDSVSCVNHSGVCKLTIAALKDIINTVKPDAAISPVDHFVLPGNEKRIKRSRERTKKYFEALKSMDHLIPSTMDATVNSDYPLTALSGVSEVAKIETVNTGRYVRGSSLRFEDAVELLRKGQCDFIDASFILSQAEHGKALILPSDEYDPMDVQFTFIDLFDPKYLEDTSKLQEKCPCPACQFMKSYIHHLFVVHELLGPACLYAHNLYQMGQFLRKLE